MTCAIMAARVSQLANGRDDMTHTEAVEALKGSLSYIDDYSDNVVTLDGQFTKAQLEAILVLYFSEKEKVAA